MELYVAEVWEDTEENNHCVGVFDNTDKAFEEANKFRDWLIKERDDEEGRGDYRVFIWVTTLNEGRDECMESEE